MIFAETPRLRLRSLEKADLPRVVELIGDWDVTKWLAVVPYPYHMAHAEEFWIQTQTKSSGKWEQFFAIADKATDAFMGGIGLRSSRVPDAPKDEAVLGYWLGKPYWGEGFMGEVIEPIVDIAFKHPEVRRITAWHDPDNRASENVLRKAGFARLGVRTRLEEAIRGNPNIVCWGLERKNPVRSLS